MNSKLTLMPLLLIILTVTALMGCKDNPTAPTPPNATIRMQRPDDYEEYKTIGEIEFLALSKNVDFTELSNQEIKDYDKNSADWYLDGNFTENEVTRYRWIIRTKYKDFYLPLGMYHYLVRTKKTAMMGMFEIKEGKSTVVVSGWYEFLFPGSGIIMPPNVGIIQP